MSNNPRLLLLRAALLLETRRKHPIENEMLRADATPGERLQISNHKKRFLSATFRDVGPCRTFNCHGLTFGARRTWIHNPETVQAILDDDDYQEVKPADVKPGDIAIYRTNTGEIDHSGIVVEAPGQLTPPKILSKWAISDEVVHFARDCPYPDTQITYWRIMR